MIQRHSSRRSKLQSSVLVERLKGAVSYDRIAGYFRSSLFEIAGEALEQVAGPIRIVCNSELDPQDVQTAVAAQSALRKNWCEGEPEKLPTEVRPRIKRLYDFLASGKLQVKVLPDSAFGLVHGKAGVIRYPGDKATSFLGSVNESATAWALNYELLWEDDSDEAVRWVEVEFDALWAHPYAVDLACCPFIVADLKRLVEREIESLDKWKINPEPSAVVVESPVYRREQGLWPHQKYFVQLAIERHRLGSARLVLADQVGLGKTVQLAMAALLMALEDDGPILVLAPKTLLVQWQDELMELLRMPSARWTGSSWIDENQIEHPSVGAQGLVECPRRIGLVSQGLIVHGNQEVLDTLLQKKYLCVIVDESHRARRKNLPKVDAGSDEIDERRQPNNLMAFLSQISRRTKSMLLATATPVQLHPVEAWDLLAILAEGHDSVLGNTLQTSPWWRPSITIAVAMDESKPLSDPRDAWNFVRDPLPTAMEDNVCKTIRERLHLKADDWTARPEAYEKLPLAIRRTKIENGWLQDFPRQHNPLLRHIVRRTRKYLEETINPVTKEPYLPKVEVRLFGEDSDAALSLGPYLGSAYNKAENFSELLAKRVKSAGFFKTLLLRRLGSSMEAGRKTVAKLLGHVELFDDDNTDDDDEEVAGEGTKAMSSSGFRDFTDLEITALQECLDIMDASSDEDPKLAALIEYLTSGAEGTGPWVDRGCILFSQYFDTVWWVSEKLAKHPQLGQRDIGVYAGSGRSGLWSNGSFRRCNQDDIKKRVREGTLKILLGTDSASEGLNLQRLGSMIHIDLPWNPTRLEQRKGRIQRIGQRNEQVWIANLRYLDSVEDRVHELLSQRLAAIHSLFGQIPDTLEDVWVDVALGNEEDAKKRIVSAASLPKNPFDQKYSQVKDTDWETTSRVIDPNDVKATMSKGW